MDAASPTVALMLTVDSKLRTIGIAPTSKTRYHMLNIMMDDLADRDDLESLSLGVRMMAIRNYLRSRI